MTDRQRFVAQLSKSQKKKLNAEAYNLSRDSGDMTIQNQAKILNDVLQKAFDDWRRKEDVE